MNKDITYRHPEYLAMTAAIQQCEESRVACEDAASRGLPALCGVDTMLAETFVRYRDGFPESRLNAGFLVGELMRKLGYTKGQEGVPCPEGYAAKSATIWLKNA